MSDYQDPRDVKIAAVKKLLNNISQLESSGGIDTDHKEIKEGLQKGDTAIGEYGLMPNTLDEFKKRYPSEITKDLSKEQLAEKAKNDPEFAEQMAATIASYLTQKRGLNEEQAAAAWERGHNAKPEDLNLQSKRAIKFRVLQKKK